MKAQLAGKASDGKALSSFVSYWHLAMTINRSWHGKNRMLKNPSLEERITWHLEHSKNCSCRPIPEKILAEIKKREKSARP